MLKFICLEQFALRTSKDMWQTVWQILGVISVPSSPSLNFIHKNNVWKSLASMLLVYSSRSLSKPSAHINFHTTEMTNQSESRVATWGQRSHETILWLLINLYCVFLIDFINTNWAVKLLNSSVWVLEVCVSVSSVATFLQMKLFNHFIF